MDAAVKSGTCCLWANCADLFCCMSRWTRNMYWIKWNVSFSSKCPSPLKSKRWNKVLHCNCFVAFQHAYESPICMHINDNLPQKSCTKRVLETRTSAPDVSKCDWVHTQLLSHTDSKSMQFCRVQLSICSSILYKELMYLPFLWPVHVLYSLFIKNCSYCAYC